MASSSSSEQHVPKETADLDGTNDKFIGHLSNYEVFKVLTELKQEQRTNSASGGHSSSYHDKSSHMPTLIYETLKYFEDTPCAFQNPKVVFDFVQRIAPFKLTKTETLNILNTRPVQPVDIQAIIEESEERLTETQVQDLIDAVEEIIPPPPGVQAKSRVQVEEEEESDEESD